MDKSLEIHNFQKISCEVINREMGRIQDEFLINSVIKGFPPILNPEDAISLVRFCREQKVKVLGIDGFHVYGQSIQPDMTESIEFSSNLRMDSDCWCAAEQFLTARINRGLFFEIVVDE
ncbi:hypothetical protein [Gimesia sp.]|uniref:hypothetical protein n=1 Tax=Gimesia sp. TaxID=2024833 RepID=UPI003A8E073E